MTKVVLITGASDGIGLEIARQSVSMGYSVFMLARDPERLRRAAETVPGILRPRFVSVDLTDERQRQAFFIGMDEAELVPDILVNNAGIGLAGEFAEMPWEKLEMLFKLNMLAVSHLNHWALNRMKKRGSGAIVNMSSVNDTLAIPTIISYCISKGGVSQLTRATSVYLSAHGIRVNAIGPGSINTDMFKAVVNDEEAIARVMSRTPLGRAGEPSEVAAIAAFLASDDASYVTGETIYVDGGRMPLNYTVPVKE